MTRVICQTERLLLRQFTLDDLDPLAAMHRDPEVSRFIGGVITLEQTRQRLQQWIEEYDRYGFSKWAVVLQASGELIGRCGLTLEQIDGVSERELGWTFARAHWGKGYATEAAAAAMEHCFTGLGLRRLISLIDPQNLASAGVAIKLGMILERTVQWQGVPTNMYAARLTGGGSPSLSARLSATHPLFLWQCQNRAVFGPVLRSLDSAIPQRRTESPRFSTFFLRSPSRQAGFASIACNP